MTKIQKIFLLSIFFFLLSTPVFAARIYFEPATNTHEVGESFTVNVRLDTQGENINAIDLGILYPPLLEIKNISKSGSAIQLWVSEPNYTSSGIFFSGGLPGGIKSSNALIAKITTRARAIGEGNLQLSSASSVLLNDGQGTKAPLTAGQVSFNIMAQSKKEPTPTPKEGEKAEPSPTPKEEEPRKEELEDKSKPKKFKILTGQDPRVFGGKYFVSFFTTDSKSGVDHYEIKENGEGYKVAQAPYLLSDQDGRTVIRVRAYDSAGNYRETVYPGLLKRIWWWITFFSN